MKYFSRLTWKLASPGFPRQKLDFGSIQDETAGFYSSVFRLATSLCSVFVPWWAKYLAYTHQTDDNLLSKKEKTENPLDNYKDI